MKKKNEENESTGSGQQLGAMTEKGDFEVYGLSKAQNRCGQIMEK